jgi:hypothetical protein
MPIEEGFRDTKSTHYGKDLTQDSRISADRHANLLLIAALIIFALWLVGLGLKGTAIDTLEAEPLFPPPRAAKLGVLDTDSG